MLVLRIGQTLSVLVGGVGWCCQGLVIGRGIKSISSRKHFSGGVDVHTHTARLMSHCSALVVHGDFIVE